MYFEGTSVQDPCFEGWSKLISWTDFNELMIHMTRKHRDEDSSVRDPLVVPKLNLRDQFIQFLIQT